MTVLPLRAGAAGRNIDPPVGLTMAGYLRSQRTTHRLSALETTAVALERDGVRVIVCGVDTLGIQGAEAVELRRRVAEATSADPSGVLLNWSHTHHAPPGCLSIFETLAGDPGRGDQVAEYVRSLHDAIVAACVAACDVLEPAWPRWGEGFVEGGLNRRQSTPEGVVPYGWDPAGPTDPSVPALQLVRPDGSVIATVVGYACHPITVDVLDYGYSADYVGAVREAVRALTDGECVFLQGAAGDISPRIASDEAGQEPRRLGRRLGIEALRALGQVDAWPGALKAVPRPTERHPGLFRWQPDATAEPPCLRAAGVDIDVPLVVSGRGRAARSSSISAVRIGEGVIVTAPGEAFVDIGRAVRRRAPGQHCLFAGYTNDLVGYLPTEQECARGGYEVEESYSWYGLDGPVSGACEDVLVSGGLALADELFS